MGERGAVSSGLAGSVSTELLERAIARRRDLIERLEGEGTDCYRLFHGIAEGRPGLALDRYGPILLVQTWREPITLAELEDLAAAVRSALGVELVPVWNHRAKNRREPFSRFHDPEIPEDPVGRELGLRYDVRPRHRGLDPLLFLDLRAGRRRLREASKGKSVLNLFAYTCAAGIAAAAGGASEVWNVDFAASALAVGERNFELNGLATDSVVLVEEHVSPVVRQFAGLPVKQRRGKEHPYQRFEARPFDVVVLDPPQWSKGRFGAVDVVRDYPSLFKPAVLATSPGGHVLATNHAPEVAVEDWVTVMRRAAEKCGRPVGAIELLTPEEDFPSFDGAPPLKIAWIEAP